MTCLVIIIISYFNIHIQLASSYYGDRGLSSCKICWQCEFGESVGGSIMTPKPDGTGFEQSSFVVPNEQSEPIHWAQNNQEQYRLENFDPTFFVSFFIINNPFASRNFFTASLTYCMFKSTIVGANRGSFTVSSNRHSWTSLSSASSLYSSPY
jgi:hypothetical protein